MKHEYAKGNLAHLQQNAKECYEVPAVSQLKVLYEISNCFHKTTILYIVKLFFDCQASAFFVYFDV